MLQEGKALYELCKSVGARDVLLLTLTSNGVTMESPGILRVESHRANIPSMLRMTLCSLPSLQHSQV